MTHPDITDRSTRCEVPGCPNDGCASSAGLWVCLDHYLDAEAGRGRGKIERLSTIVPRVLNALTTLLPTREGVA